MIRIHESEMPREKSFAEQIMHAAERMPRVNKGGAASALKALTDAEKLTVRREHAKGAAVITLAKRFGVSEGQIRNCVA